MKDNGHPRVIWQGTHGGWLFCMLTVSLLPSLSCRTTQSKSPLTSIKVTPTWIVPRIWIPQDLQFILESLNLAPTAKKKTPAKTTPASQSGKKADKHSDVVYQLTHSMNQSVDPCHDFYQYTCGSCHLAHNSQEGDRLRNVVSSRLRALLEKPYDSATEGGYINTTKNLYHSCVDEDQLQIVGGRPVRRLLGKLGMQFCMSYLWFPRSWDLETILVDLAYVGVAPFFKITVDADAQDNTKQIVWINPSKLGLSRQYLVLGRSSKEVSAYRHWLHDLAVHVLLLTPSPALRNTITEIVDFEIKLAQFYPRSRTESSVSSENHKKLVFSQMNAAYPKFNWTKCLTLNFERAKVKLLPHLPVAVHHHFVQNLTRILAQTDRRVVAKYLLMRVVLSTYTYLSKEIRDLEMPLRKVLFGATKPVVRWTTCVSSISKIMMNAVGSLYVTHHFSPQAKKKATAVVEFIRDSMQEVIRQSQWIDSATKAKALEKSQKLKANVGYPENLLNKTYLEGMYKSVVFDPKDFFHNVMKVSFISAFGNARAILRPAINENEWTVSPTEVNAYYDATLNVMFCPAAILQPPFYGDAYPMSTVFGAIGMVFAHELTHAFDDQGRKFDEEGNKASWWTRDSKLKYDKLAQCFVAQFSNITFAGHRVSGEATLSENIADNGGVKIAFLAFLRWQQQNGPEKIVLPNLPFTQEQLFFINLAQIWCNVQTNQQAAAQMLISEHSPEYIRSNMIASNSGYFAKAFNCSAESKMNPPKKCQLW